VKPPHGILPSENPVAQTQYLDWIASQEIPLVEITLAELQENEAFRKRLESILKDAVAKNYSGDLGTIDLVGFGSLASGFATPDSDMDLALVPIWKDDIAQHGTEIPKEIPRLLERAILDARMGGRLLTRTRVPILKVCQLPSEALYTALSDERKKWDDLPEEEKYADPPKRSHPPSDPKPQADQKSTTAPNSPNLQDPSDIIAAMDITEYTGESNKRGPRQSTPSDSTEAGDAPEKASKPKEDRPPRQWYREKVLGPLDFPKTGVGIQCDINFSNALGLHNTHLLRCYSLCDPRVRPMILFVKAWAKRRKINNSYSGTLSSYGWVLMVLHYLVNIAQPPVCPNLQLCHQPPTDIQALEHYFKDSTVDGYSVRFWRNEQEIIHAARSNQLTRNTQSLGALLRGFFQYYAALNNYTYGQRIQTFHWTTQVISLRTQGGIRTKLEKDWTGAKTTLKDGKEVRHRYLFAIEDPFELDHNVARTVTHNGIVAIRDEFRRAWRILSAIGRNADPGGGLFDEVVEEPPPSPPKANYGGGAELNEVGVDVAPTGRPHPGGRPKPVPEQHLRFPTANKDVDFPPLG
jgi:terminal uridylyltransferase